MKPQTRAIIALSLALFVGGAGCARKAPVLIPQYPYSSAATKVFYATSSGLSETAPQALAGSDIPASAAPNASVLGADSRLLAVAVNGWGVERVEASPDGAAYRIVDSPQMAAFAGLSTAGIWPLCGGFLVQLYRDPFSGSADSGEGAGGGASAPAPLSPSRLVFIDVEGGARTPPPLPVEAGYELFALLPSEGDWFAELRKDTSERVDLKFLAFSDPLAPSPSLREVQRAEFESALKPQALSTLATSPTGPSLRSALGALGPGPWLIRLRSAAGEDRWYLSSGTPEEAVNVYAWSLLGPGDDSMGRVLVLAPDGRLALADSQGEPRLSVLAAPVPGSTFTAVAVAGKEVAAAWESGDFPDISSAGIIMCPLP